MIESFDNIKTGLEALDGIDDTYYDDEKAIIEKELKVLRRIKMLIERVDFIGNKHYIVFIDGHYMMISNNLYKILKRWLNESR